MITEGPTAVPKKSITDLGKFVANFNLYRLPYELGRYVDKGAFFRSIHFAFEYIDRFKKFYPGMIKQLSSISNSDVIFKIYGAVQHDESIQLYCKVIICGQWVAMYFLETLVNSFLQEIAVMKFEFNHFFIRYNHFQRFSHKEFREWLVFFDWRKLDTPQRYCNQQYEYYVCQVPNGRVQAYARAWLSDKFDRLDCDSSQDLHYISYRNPINKELLFLDSEVNLFLSKAKNYRDAILGAKYTVLEAKISKENVIRILNFIINPWEVRRRLALQRPFRIKKRGGSSPYTLNFLKVENTPNVIVNIKTRMRDRKKIHLL